MNSSLSKRAQTILRATVQHYIATAEPVGSKTLAQTYDFSVSSATIRNILSRLEKAGLLYQPHISAGRVPSDSGYRIYVDQLITPDESVECRIDQYLNRHHLQAERNHSLEALLQQAAQMLATLSGYIALITLPQATNSHLKHLQLLPVAPGQVMMVIVMDTYQTQSVLIESAALMHQHEQLEEEWIDRELRVLSNFLNSKLKGRTLGELSTLDWGELDREFACYADFVVLLLGELKHRAKSSASPKILIRGISEVLRQPEFSQLDSVQTLLHLLEEEQEQLMPLILAWPELDEKAPRTNILIGHENPLASLRPCTLISTIYCQRDMPIGSVGLIGPTRMLYQNAIALVESTANYLSAALTASA